MARPPDVSAHEYEEHRPGLVAIADAFMALSDSPGADLAFSRSISEFCRRAGAGDAALVGLYDDDAHVASAAAVCMRRGLLEDARQRHPATDIVAGLLTCADKRSWGSADAAVCIGALRGDGVRALIVLAELGDSRVSHALPYLHLDAPDVVAELRRSTTHDNPRVREFAVAGLSRVEIDERRDVDGVERQGARDVRPTGE